jgi:hypothetical protein
MRRPPKTTPHIYKNTHYTKKRTPKKKKKKNTHYTCLRPRVYTYMYIYITNIAGFPCKVWITKVIKGNKGSTSAYAS